MALPPSRRLDFSEVPVIDVSPFVEGDRSREAATAEAMRQVPPGWWQCRRYFAPRQRPETFSEILS